MPYAITLNCHLSVFHCAAPMKLGSFKPPADWPVVAVSQLAGNTNLGFACFQEERLCILYCLRFSGSSHLPFPHCEMVHLGTLIFSKMVAISRRYGLFWWLLKDRPVGGRLALLAQLLTISLGTLVMRRQWAQLTLKCLLLNEQIIEWPSFELAYLATSCQARGRCWELTGPPATSHPPPPPPSGRPLLVLCALSELERHSICTPK